MRAPAAKQGVSSDLRTPSCAEAAILAKAAALSLEPPAFCMHDAPELFAGWADRVAEADSLRAAGKPYAAALDECDRHLGRRPTRVLPRPLAILPLSDWLADIARILDEPFTPAPASAVR